MGPHEMHPRVLRELADVVANSLSLISHGSQGKSQVTGKGETCSQKGEPWELAVCQPPL